MPLETGRMQKEKDRLVITEETPNMTYGGVQTWNASRQEVAKIGSCGLTHAMHNSSTCAKELEQTAARVWLVCY